MTRKEFEALKIGDILERTGGNRTLPIGTICTLTQIHECGDIKVAEGGGAYDWQFFKFIKHGTLADRYRNKKEDNDC